MSDRTNLYQPTPPSVYALERASWSISKNATRRMISGICISTPEATGGGRALDVRKFYVAPARFPLPLLVNHDWQLATGLVHSLTPKGTTLEFTAELFNADTREWSIDPWGALLLQELLAVSVKAVFSERSFGFTIEEVSLVQSPADQGAGVDRIWTVEPFVRLGGHTVNTLWESPRRMKAIAAQRAAYARGVK